MTRPRKHEPRQHQLNVRFTTRELVRIHQHAALTGKTLTDFSRTVMLRRPRPRAKAAPELVSLTPRRLDRWRSLGNAVNDLAHGLNLRRELDARALARLLVRLRLALRQAFPRNFQPDAAAPAYSLAPVVRTQLRKTCTNLVQIADHYRFLGLTPPLPLSNLIGRLRAVLNGYQSPHGP